MERYKFIDTTQSYHVGYADPLLEIKVKGVEFMYMQSA